MTRHFNRFDGGTAFGEKRLFITGGTGFFGKSMLDYRLRHPEWLWAKAEWVILSRSPECFAMVHPRLANQRGVSFAVGDVRDFAFPKCRFDAIIHAATSVSATLSDEETTSVIVDGARHVAEFAKAIDCPRLLFTSSGAVYGPKHAPVDETALLLQPHTARVSSQPSICCLTQTLTLRSHGALPSSGLISTAACSMP